MRAPAAWVVRFAPRIAARGLVLDLAAGNGRHTRYLRTLGYRVVAVDRDVSELSDFASDDGVEVVEADLESAPWPLVGRRFDGIVVTNYLHRPLLPILAESLAPRGVLIYETFALGNQEYGRPRNPDFLLREGELLRAFSQTLSVIDYEHGYETRPRPAVKQRICAVADADTGGDTLPLPRPKDPADLRGKVRNRRAGGR